MVRALAFHQCGRSSISEPGVIQLFQFTLSGLSFKPSRPDRMVVCVFTGICISMKLKTKSFYFCAWSQHELGVNVFALRSHFPQLSFTVTQFEVHAKIPLKVTVAKKKNSNNFHISEGKEKIYEVIIFHQHSARAAALYFYPHCHQVAQAWSVDPTTLIMLCVSQDFVVFYPCSQGFSPGSLH